MPRRHLLLVTSGLIWAGLSVAVLAGVWSSAEWDAFAAMMAAGATVGLGGVTVWLVLTTKDMVSKAGVEISMQRQRMEDATKPHVFPAPSGEWGDANKGFWRSFLPVTNGGPGVALNVKARLQWGPPSEVVGETVPTSLGPGESRDIPIRGQPPEDWGEQVRGLLHYGDAPGDTWETRFRIYRDGDRYLVEVQGTQMIKSADGTVVREETV